MQVMSKHWDYEDDHDWDDDIDYAAMGYVYWYGKYYPKPSRYKAIVRHLYCWSLIFLCAIPPEIRP